jgi:hypothetical protein
MPLGFGPRSAEADVSRLSESSKTNGPFWRTALVFVRGNWSSGIIFALFLILVAPSIVNYTPYYLAWDDTYFFHRAVCFHDAVYRLDVAGMADCYSLVSKSPILTFTTLPWGPAASGEGLISMAMIALAIFIWIFVVVVYCVAVSAGAAVWPLLVAGLAVWFNPFLKGYGGFFISDILLAWCTALLLLLIPLELRSKPGPARMDVTRGALWGLVIFVGVLTKTTFIFFLGPIAIAVIWIRFRRLGMPSCLRAALTAVVCSFPATVIWARFWRNYVGHAVEASFGGVSKFYAVAGLTPALYLRGYIATCRWGCLPTAALLLYFAWKVRKANAQWFRILPVALILIFLAICSTIPINDYRYAMPVMIGLPFVLAVLPSNEEGSRIYPSAAVLGFGLLACVLCSIPMIGRIDLTYVRYAGAVLDEIARPGTKIMLATETPSLNFETLLLAKELGGSRLHKVAIDSLIYDQIRGLSINDSYRRMEWADYVLFDKPPLLREPKWENQFASEFYQYAIGMADEVDSAPHDYMNVLKLRPSGARDSGSNEIPRITAIATDPTPPVRGIFHWTLTGSGFTPNSRVTITGHFCDSGCEISSGGVTFKSPTELAGLADLTTGSGVYQFQVKNGSLISNAATIELKKH